MKRLCAVLLLVLGSRFTVEAQVTNGLVGWWKLDENAGSSAADASGSGHAGTLVNSPTWTNGVSGTALTMGGVKRVDIGPWSGYCLTNAITLSIWVKPVELPEPFDDNYPFFCQGYGYYAGWALKYYGNTNRMKVVFQMTGMNGNSLTSATPIPTNYWTQIAVTFDGTVAKLYLNGQLNRSTTFAGTRLATNDVVTIGKLTYDSFGPGGTFDDARVYNRALSEAEVIQLFITHDRDLDGVIDANELILGTDPDNRDTDGDGYSDGLEALGGTDPLDAGSHPASPSGLVGWWKMDETSGATAADATTNANHGTITGATWTDGILSNALQMATIYNYVTCGSTSTGNALAVTTPTITFWGRVTNLAQNVTVVERWDGSHGYMVQWQGSYNRITPVLPGCGVVPVGLDAVVENEWNHFAFSYNGTQVCSYLNGQLISATTYTNNIGPAASKFYWLLLGQLDDGRVYGRGLSAGEVAVLALADSDGDGLTDAQEMRLGTNPSKADTDGDGIPDGWEIQNGFTATNSIDGVQDADGDGLTNAQEYLAGTNPRNPDTDGDGIGDGDDDDPRDPAKGQKASTTVLRVYNAYGIYTNSGASIYLRADVRSTNAAVTVAAAEYFDTTTLATGSGAAMTAFDGTFNSTNETAIATFTPTFGVGERRIFWLHAKDSGNQWSPFVKVIINPNINDILDKIQTNYSAFADLQFSATTTEKHNGAVYLTSTAVVKMKGPYKTRSESPTGIVAVQNENSHWWHNADLSISGMLQSGYDADFNATANRDSDFYWDVSLWKARAAASISNSSNSAIYNIRLDPVAGTPWPMLQTRVDFTKGIVTQMATTVEDMSITIEYLGYTEAISGAWIFTTNRQTMQFAGGDTIVIETAATNIQANQNLNDSVFDIPTE